MACGSRAPVDVSLVGSCFALSRQNHEAVELCSASLWREVCFPGAMVVHQLQLHVLTVP